MMQSNFRKRLLSAASNRLFWLAAAVVGIVSVIGVYGIWHANIQMLDYLTIRQAQSGSAQTAALLKEFGEEIHLNIFLQAFLFLLVEFGLVICFLYMARQRRLKQRLEDLAVNLQGIVDAKGHLNLTPIGFDGTDEAAALARGVNALLEKIRPSYQALEETLTRQNRALEEIRSRRQQEIQRRRQAEKDLMLRQFIVDHAGEAVYLVEADGRIADVNDVACRWLGYSRSELLGMTIAQIDPHFPSENWPKHWETTRRQKQMLIETEHRRKDGTCFPVEIALTHFECDGKEYHCAFARDLTRRKQEEQIRIQEAEAVQAQQQALLQLTTMPAFINGDVEAVARYLTEAGARLLKVRRCSFWLYEERDNQLRCQDLYDARTGEHSSGFIVKGETCPDYLKALQTGRVIDADDAWRDPRTQDLLDTYLRPLGVVSLLDATVRFSGKFIGVFSTESVETKRHWTDLEIRFAAELADQISLVLLNRSYRQSERQARQEARSAVSANQAKSNFLASMSHEIRTPMNAILGFVDLLAQEPLSEEQMNYVKVIQNSACNLLSLLNDIIDFSKIEAGKMKVEIADCHLPGLLEDLDSMMRPQASRKNLDFQILQCQELPEKIRTDGLRLRQCLLNLLSNAVKFTEKGHVYLNVSKLDEDGQSWIQFAVEDTGIGISPEHHSSIFDAYIQVENRSGRGARGAGLGLAITRNLVHMLGGRLRLTSTPGVGSVFTLSLPLVPSPQANPLWNKYDAASLSGTAAEDNCLAGHVLVVEDNPSNQILISMLLKKMGLEVTLANDGLEGVQEARRQKYDVILMDMQMPRMNGYDATQTLRSEGCMTPIVAVTANAMKGDEEKCLQAGCDAYLSKPIDRKKLAQILRRYLGTSAKAELPVAAAAEAGPPNSPPSC
ncbi:MAG: response regulator [Anaerohalosphaeraceae bacterium]